MNRRCAGNGLLLAGMIVTLVGLAVALTATLGIPRHWTTVGVGLALLATGVVRRALRPRDES
ncbi:MAG TPA: hypothetical protein VNF03_12065 [Patescibacteria group bacterium]|jgi:hypothetical protein|nr:hypothetical protein [Patescibacteria group bacterium]